jgi:hypothetical protein
VQIVFRILTLDRDREKDTRVMVRVFALLQAVVSLSLLLLLPLPPSLRILPLICSRADGESGRSRDEDRVVKTQSSEREIDGHRGYQERESTQVANATDEDGFVDFR